MRQLAVRPMKCCAEAGKGLWDDDDDDDADGLARARSPDNAARCIFHELSLLDIHVLDVNAKKFSSQNGVWLFLSPPAPNERKQKIVKSK